MIEIEKYDNFSVLLTERRKLLSGNVFSISQSYDHLLPIGDCLESFKKAAEFAFKRVENK